MMATTTPCAAARGKCGCGGGGGGGGVTASSKRRLYALTAARIPVVGGRGREWRENEEENDDEYEENGENRDVESSAERGAIERYFIERRETRVENHAHVWDASPSAEREEQIPRNNWTG